MSTNRSADVLRNLPPTTLGVIGICVSIYVVQATIMGGWNIQLFTMCPRLILFTHEYYRVFTSVFFHANLMHIGMNMLSTSAISSVLEKKLGTMRLLFSIWWAILLTSAIYIMIAYVAYVVVGYDTWMYQHAVGFSGIIFHLSVLESYLHPGSRSVFGFFSVPAFVYPWVLLLALQLIMPNLSFLGHLAGILTGTLQCHGVLDILFVGDSFLIELESWPMMRKVVSLDSFVATTHGSGQLLRTESSSSSSALPIFQSIRKVLSIVFKFLRDILETILVCICGRNYRFNINANSTRFWERRTNLSNTNDNNIECGVIRPPEFYEGSLYDNDNAVDEEEREPLASRIV